jgi:hypothetical protein
MNLLTSLHSIFQHEESLRREEEVEATGLEEEEEVEATCNTPCYGSPKFSLITFIRGLIVH